MDIPTFFLPNEQPPVVYGTNQNTGQVLTFQTKFQCFFQTFSPGGADDNSGDFANIKYVSGAIYMIS